MKKIYITLLILAVSLSSCFDDLGNYSYKAINEVEISGLNSSYRIEYPDGLLKIEPEVESSLPNISSDRYTYEWKAVEAFPKTGSYIIGTEKNLNTEPGLLPGNYTLYYKIMDKETNIIWSNYTSLNVATSTARGFLLIGNDKDGNMQLDMIRMPVGQDTTVAVDLLRNANLPPQKGATNVMFTGVMANMDNSKLWVMSKEGSNYVNRATFEAEPYHNFRNLTYTMIDLPDGLTAYDIAPRVTRVGGTASTTGARAVSTLEGHVFFASNLIAGDVYANPVNRTSTNSNEYFKAAPYMMYAMGYWRGFLIYDTDNNRFTYCSSLASNVSALNDGPNDVFPWNQGDTGRKLVYAENTKNTMNGASYGSSFALMKDNSNEYHIYMINPLFPSKAAYYKIDKSKAANIDNAANSKIMAFSSSRTLMFYASGSDLYYYDFNKGNEKGGILKSFDNEEITMLQFDIQTENNQNRDLYIGTKNSAGEGTVRKFVIGTNVDVVDYTVEDKTEWTGLSAIVKMDWRNAE